MASISSALPAAKSAFSLSGQKTTSLLLLVSVAGQL